MEAGLLIASTALAILTALGTIIQARKFISAQNVQGQLMAKDATIETNEQTIEALQQRVASMEVAIRAMEARAAEAVLREAQLQDRLLIAETRLEKYATGAFQDLLDRMEVQEHKDDPS